MPVDASTKTIVLIDDEDTVISLFYYMLEREGFKVVPFRSATDAIAKLSAKRYKIDLIVLDLMMPGMGGYDMVKKLQELEIYRSTPIYILTARNLDGETVEMIRAEPNVKGFYPKPADHKEFTSSVHKLLDTRKSEQAPTPSGSDPDDPFH